MMKIQGTASDTGQDNVYFSIFEKSKSDTVDNINGNRHQHDSVNANYAWFWGKFQVKKWFGCGFYTKIVHRKWQASKLSRIKNWFKVIRRPVNVLKSLVRNSLKILKSFIFILFHWDWLASINWCKRYDVTVF